MPLPTITTEIAFASAWNSGAPTWVDVSAYVRGIDINRGRSNDLDAFTAGTASVILDNRDGRFNPSNTAGPYSPNVRPRKQIRIRATWNATTYPLFYGYVQTWPQEYPAMGEDAVTTVTAVDALALLGGMTIPVDELTARVGAGELPAPFFRYKMGDTNTDFPRYIDASGNGYDMPSGSFQATGPQLAPYLDDASSAFAYGNGASGFTIPPTGTTNWTVTFWMQSTQVGASATAYATLFAMGVYEQIPTRIAIDENGFIYAKAYDFIPGFSPSVRSTVKVNDGIPHHVAIVSSGGSGMTVYIDGVNRTSTIVSASAGHGGTVTIARPPITNNAAGATDIDYYGFLQEVIYWQSSLTATQVGFVYGCGTGLATGELTSARFSRLLTSVWSGAPTAITTGNGYCSTSEYNTNALAALQKVANTEGALFFVDRAGTITLRNRYYSQTATEGKTSQATFGDDTGVGYKSMGFRYDADQMANTYVVNSGIGVPQTGSNSSSVTSYGRRTQNVDTLLSTVDALSMAQGLAAQYGQPLLRSLPFTVNMNTNTATTAPAVLNLELGYQITLRRNANGVATPIVQTLTLNSIAHSIRPGQWTTVLDGSPRQLFDFFILDSSTLDGTSVLGY